MKVLQLDSERLLITDRAETRWLLGISFVVLGCITILVPVLYRIPVHSTDWQRTLSTVLAGILFCFLGSSILATTEVVVCKIDKALGMIGIKRFTVKGCRSEHLDINQVVTIELKEMASTYYYVYKVNFVINGARRIALTCHSTSDRAEMKALSAQVSHFLNINTLFSGSDDALISIPPF
jgi:hypothetical protein